MNEDNKEAFEYAYEKFTESLRQNPNRITNIQYLLKAVNDSTPEQTRYELVVEKLIHCLIDDPPGEGGYIDVQSPDSNFIDYLNRGIASLLNKKEYRSQLIMAIKLFVKTIEQIRLYSIPFSLQKQRHFEENNEKFDYYEKQVELLDKIATFLKENPIEICENLCENKKAYKLIKIQLKEALCKDGSISPMLEKNIKNLEEKGLSYLPIIEELCLNWTIILLLSLTIAIEFGLFCLLIYLVVCCESTYPMIILFLSGFTVTFLIFILKDSEAIIKYCETGEFNFRN